MPVVELCNFERRLNLAIRWQAKSPRTGSIHERRRQFFLIFDTPLPHVGSFLVLSVGNFDQFLTPPNFQRLWTAPLQIVLLSIAINKLPCS